MWENKVSGEFEFIVLLAALRLGEEACAVPIVDDIRAGTERSVTRAAVCVTLQRLEWKGLVESYLGTRFPSVAAVPRRHVRLTAAGRAAVREAKAAFVGMWAGLDPAVGRS